MEIALGTVQFGQPYGIANHEIVPPNEVRRILHEASSAGVKLVDTAPDYGNSQALLGNYLTHDALIVTKTPRFGGDSINTETVRDCLSAFDTSLAQLHRDGVYALMVHYCEDVFKPGSQMLFDALQQLKADGRVRRIGVSAYTREQVERVIEKHAIDIVQIPINVLDQRATGDPFLSDLKSRGIEIHARSIFLQGLLLLDPMSLDPYFGQIRKNLGRYHDTLRRLGLSAVEGALAFIKQIDNIDYVVVGAKSLDEFREIMSAWMSPRSAGIDFRRFALHEEAILNPSCWRLK